MADPRPVRSKRLLPVLLASLAAAALPSGGATAQPDTAASLREQQEVLQAVEDFFRAMRSRDLEGVAARLIADGSLFFQRRNPDGSYRLHHLSNAEWLARYRSWTVSVGDDNWNSQVQVWGPVATVSHIFVFSVDGRVRHCGVNLIQLVRDGALWRIANIVWTEERSGCPDPSTGR